MESGPDVLEDVHGTELPETDGTVERQHPLPDILRRDNRSDRPLTNYKLLDDMMLELAGVRATAMEGSFGTQKEHYDLRRVKARTKRTEILYIFFCIHAANDEALSNQ